MRHADVVFQSCANQASRKAWLSRGRVPNEFRPRHALLMTHLWMVHRRLMAEGESSKQVQEAVFDKLWEDTSHRIRSTGIAELMVNKSLGDVQKYSFPLLVAYDQALAQPSPEEQADHLGAAVWRNIWVADPVMTVEHCMEMARYIRKQQSMLDATDASAVMEGRIPWSDVPSWKGIRSVVAGSDDDAAASEDEDDGEDEESEWRSALANTGKTYYWNVKTRETSWDKPEGFK